MNDRARRLLIAYHGAGLASSAKLFDSISAHDGVRLRVLGPRKGYLTMDGKVCEIRKPRYGKYDLVTGRLYRGMRDSSHPYWTGFLREIIRFRPDVIHVFSEAYSGVFVQALLYRNLFRRQARCYCLGAENVIRRTAATRQEAWRRSFAHKHTDGVACWSTSAVQALTNAGFPASRLHLTYWGIPLDWFFPVRNEALRQTLGLSGSFVLGVIGRLDPQKGLWTLLHAMKRLPESVKCLCIGNGRWAGDFEAKIREFGLEHRIRRLPEIPAGEVPAYMNALDALVMPSETMRHLIEQFGRVLPEAMACGVPVIGSDSGAIPEVIGEAGLVFPERDFVELAQCIRRLADDRGLCRALGDAGRTRAGAWFSCEAYVARLMRMYSMPLDREGTQAWMAV